VSFKLSPKSIVGMPPTKYKLIFSDSLTSFLTVIPKLTSALVLKEAIDSMVSLTVWYSATTLNVKILTLRFFCC
jgi:hypothetical protein